MTVCRGSSSSLPALLLNWVVREGIARCGSSAAEVALMFLRCPCGYTLTDIACPGRIVHHLLSAHGVERLQDAMDREVEAHGVVDEWPEHWDAARTAESWLCPKCSRLFIGVNGPGPVRVFALECIGIEPGSTGIDSQLAPMPELLDMAREQAGESPLCSN